MMITNKGLITPCVYLMSKYPTSKPSPHKLPQISKWKFCLFHGLDQKRFFTFTSMASYGESEKCHFYLPNLPAFCLFLTTSSTVPNPHFLLLRLLRKLLILPCTCSSCVSNSFKTLSCSKLPNDFSLKQLIYWPCLVIPYLCHAGCFY